MGHRLDAVGKITQLAEGEARGREWRVTVIKAGTSQNGVTYPLAVLHEARALFEGARVLVRSDEEHSKGTSDVRDAVGWLSDVKAVPHGLDATMHLLEASGISDRMVEAWERGNRKFAGLSIVAVGEVSLRMSGGRRERIARKIARVKSVDLVMHPAAGGELVALTAAQNEEGSTMLEKLCKLLEAKAPKKWEQIKDKELTESLVLDTLTEAIAENATSANPMTKEDLAAFTEALKELKEARANQDPDDGAGDGDPADGDPIDVKKLVTEGIAEATKQIRQAHEQERFVESRLSGVAKPIADRVRARASAQVMTEAQINEVLKEEVEYAESIAGPSFRSRTGAASARASGLTPGEQKKLRMDAFFAEAAVEYDGQKYEPYESAREMYAEITGDRRVTGDLHEAVDAREFAQDLDFGRSPVVGGAIVLSEAVASDTWAQALGDSIRRSMVRMFKDHPSQLWQLVSDIATAPDFRTKHNVLVGGYGNLPTVLENAAYQALSTPTDWEETYAISKKGGIETVSIEAISNDDVGMIRRIPRNLANAALHTLNEDVLNIFVNNPAMGDSENMFSAAHGNTSAAALGETSLKAMDQQIRKQTMPTGNGGGAGTRRLHLKGVHLLTPIDLIETAWRLTTYQNPAVQGGVGNVASNDDAALRYTRSLGITPHVVDYWTDASDYVLIGDKRERPILEVGFWNGKRTPDLFVADNPSQGSLFTNDQIQYKIRFVYGVGILDYRNAAKATVT